ncbi:hypothetical protein GCM10027436_72210 [Actinophytocola sediminis]
MHVEVGLGGLNHYRGTAMALATLMPTTVHQPKLPLARRTEWNSAKVPVLAWSTVDDVVDHLLRHTSAGDLIVKYAGAFGVQTDIALDRALLELRRRTGCVLVYADPDAPHRLPLFGPRSDLPFAAADGVWCFQGGERAVREYARMLGDRDDLVRVAPFGVSALPALAAVVPPAPDRRFDLVTTIGAVSSREDRLVGLLRRTIAGWPRAARPLRVGLCGPVPADLAGDLRSLGAEVTVRPPADPHELLAWYGQGRYTVNLLRAECRGYPDVPACRLFEAVAMGSVPVTEYFDGLESYFSPTRHLHLLDELAGLPIAVSDPATDAARTRVADAAASRLHAVARASRDALTVLVETTAPAGVSPPPPRVLPCGQRIPLVGSWHPRGLASLSELLGPDVALSPTRAEVSSLDTDVLAVTASLKNQVDATLREQGNRVSTMYVDVTGLHDSGAVRWVPGRDVAIPNDSGWPWLSGSSTAGAR